MFREKIWVWGAAPESDGWGGDAWQCTIPPARRAGPEPRWAAQWTAGRQCAVSQSRRRRKTGGGGHQPIRHRPRSRSVFRNPTDWKNRTSLVRPVRTHL